MPIARTAYSCHVAGRNCIGPTARSKLASPSRAPWSVSGIAGYPWLPSSSGPRIRGLATPDQLGLDEPPPRAWSDSMRPIPASTDQLRWQFGAALASACAALMYAASASRGIVPEPDQVGRTAGDKAAGACEGRPTDAGCRTTAGTSQLAGAMTALGVDDAGPDDDTGYVTPTSAALASEALASEALASAGFATGWAAAFATAGSRGKPPEAWESTNAAERNATAAEAAQTCARGVVRRTFAWRAATTRTPCFGLLACSAALECCARRTCRAALVCAPVGAMSTTP